MTGKSSNVGKFVAELLTEGTTVVNHGFLTWLEPAQPIGIAKNLLCV